MRYFVLCALFLGACASTTTTTVSQLRGGKPANKDDFRKFYQELAEGNFDYARTIARQKNLNRRLVFAAVEREMWKIITMDTPSPSEAKMLARTFQLTNSRQLKFGYKAYHHAINNKLCKTAAHVAFYFELGPKSVDKAINCMIDNTLSHNINDLYHVTCVIRGTPALLQKLMNTWVHDFKKMPSSARFYSTMMEMASVCPLSAGQFLDLFVVGVDDGQLDFALVMLQMVRKKGLSLRYNDLYRQLYQIVMSSPDHLYNLGVAGQVLSEKMFEKTSHDYDLFINRATALFRCDEALEVALKHRLSASKVSSILYHPRCENATFANFDLSLIHPDQVGWLFEVSLQAENFLFARNMVSKFDMGEYAVNRVISAALSVKDLDSLMAFDPPPNINRREYQERTLEIILNANEEWFVVRYALSRVNDRLSEYINWYAWIERAYLRALQRKAFDLAADIAGKHLLKEWRSWAIRMVFDEAMRNNDAESAKLVAKRWNLGEDAVRRAVLLGWERNKEESRKQSQSRKKRGCQFGDPWGVRRCK